VNHLVAQLVAHQVPLNLGHLYTGREARAVEWDGSPVRVRAGSVSDGGHAVAHASGSDGTAVMDGYLAVLERFLDVQREVTAAYLAGRAPGDSLPLEGLPDFPEPAPPPFALVGTVEHLEPGRSVVIRRVMDEREDLYADDHTLGGRGVSRVNPAQNGL